MFEELYFISILLSVTTEKTLLFVFLQDKKILLLEYNFSGLDCRKFSNNIIVVE